MKLPWSSEWTFETIHLYNQHIANIAKDFGLDTYRNEVEVITSRRMLELYSSVGMPVGYTHWSQGKQFVREEGAYKGGSMGLAYEIVINTEPCKVYLMEENSLTMQALVIAHAGYGHNSFFKGNALFRAWTEADAIINYLDYAEKYIATATEKLGEGRVTRLLDACHALRNQGINKYPRRQKRSLADERRLSAEREEIRQYSVNDLWRTIPKSANVEVKDKKDANKNVLKEPQENLLYFFEKNAPFLEPEEREIVRIVRMIAQYFYPQMQTQIMNEGWATFWHYTILNEMYDRGLLEDGFMIEFLKSHSNVIYQPSYDHPRGGGLNVYALGFAMFSDMRRVCERGTWRGGAFIPNDAGQQQEDNNWFPHMVGSDWKKVLQDAMKNYRDESFIMQFLSPKVIRDFRLFVINDNSGSSEYVIDSIHDDDGYRNVRRAFASSRDITKTLPDIQAVEVDQRTDRKLTLRYTPQDGSSLEEKSMQKVVQYAANLWTCPVVLIEAKEGSTRQLASAKPQLRKD